MARAELPTGNLQKVSLQNHDDPHVRPRLTVPGVRTAAPSRLRPPGGGHGPGYGVTGPARSSVRPKDGSKWSNVTASGISESITNDSS